MIIKLQPSDPERVGKEEGSGLGEHMDLPGQRELEYIFQVNWGLVRMEGPGVYVENRWREGV